MFREACFGGNCKDNYTSLQRRCSVDLGACVHEQKGFRSYCHYGFEFWAVQSGAGAAVEMKIYCLKQ